MKMRRSAKLTGRNEEKESNMKKMLEGNVTSFKQAYELALMKYTQINRRSEALLVDVRAYDPGAMVRYPKCS